MISYLVIFIYQVYSLSGNGQVCIWEADTELDGLIPYEESDSSDSEDSDDEIEDEMGNLVTKSNLRKRQDKEGALIFNVTWELLINLN